MKKLLITVVVLGVSICASAASFNWSVANDWFSPDGNNDLEGTAYFFDAGTHSMATIADGLANSGLAALSGNLGSKALEYGGLSDFAGTGFNYDGTAPTSITGFLIVVSEDEKNYWTVGETTVTVTDAIKGGKQAVFNFGTTRPQAQARVSEPSHKATKKPRSFECGFFVAFWLALLMRVCDGERGQPCREGAAAPKSAQE